MGKRAKEEEIYRWGGNGKVGGNDKSRIIEGLLGVTSRSTATIPTFGARLHRNRQEDKQGQSTNAP